MPRDRDSSRERSSRSHKRSRQDYDSRRDRDDSRERDRKRHKRRDSRDRDYRDRRDDDERYDRRRERDYSPDRRNYRRRSREKESQRDRRSPRREESPKAPSMDFSDIGAKLAQAKAEMEKKKALLQGTSIPEPEKVSETSEAAKRAIRLAEQKMKSKVSSIPILGTSDSIDKLIALQTVQIKDSLINRRLGREKLESSVQTTEIDPESTKYFDSRLAPKRVGREKRSFNFVTPGTYVRQGLSMRAEKFTNQNATFNEADPLNKRLFLQLRREPVPNVEWWDRHLVPSHEDRYDTEAIVLAHIGFLVEHPVPEKLPSTDRHAASTFLTKKERKKLRRQHREEVQKESQIKIMLGIEKPPEARATLSNMTRVYGAEAFEDPTRIDQLVRKQMQERLDKHNEQNQERKLTPEEKKQKKLDKLRKNESGEIHVVVFKIKDLSNPLHRKNIDHTTRDGALSGVLIICSEGDCNLLVAEGAPRAIKKLKRLLHVRLKWKENNPENRCDEVWEGLLQRRQFKKFRFYETTTKKESREILTPRNLVHYWDTADCFTDELVE